MLSLAFSPESHPTTMKGNTMGNWIVHIVGETIDDDIAPIITKAVDEIQALNHRVKQVRLTTDAGERIIHVAQKVEDVADTVTKDVSEVVPALAPEAAAADTVVHTVGDEVKVGVEDIEKAEGTPLPDTEATTANPPQAGASSTASSPSSTTPPAPIPS